ncbi:MAG: GNAT family N-acetyltransferase [Pseudomonadota bacterium]
MTVASIKDQCVSGEVWTIGRPPHACIFLKEQVDSLYVGKMAVSDAMRGRGCARQLIRLAADRARSKRLPVLELETRIELHENHETFRRLGFVKVGEGAHAGFDRPTYIVMRKPV